MMMFERYLGRLRWPLLALAIAGAAALAIFASSAQAAPPAPAGAQSQGATPDDVNRVAKQLYCPVCPNTPLNVCETQACKDWRELIRQKLAAGAGDQDIIDYFVEQYGQRVLAAPPPQGFNLLIWIMPAAALAAGLGALGLVLHSWSARTWSARTSWSAGQGKPPPGVAAAQRGLTVPDPHTGELPPDYVARVERELQAMRSH